jgi:D-tyrosyl-tRNA(Tyr) deacylase
MRAVIQRVNHASLKIDGIEFSSIDKGYLVLLGIEERDTLDDINWLVPKIVGMRIMDDSEGKMNLSLADAGGEVMIVSQFTLFASTKKGNRPSFTMAAKPDQAIPLYEKFIEEFTKCFNNKIATGVFGADMKITLLNDGPVTIIVDSKNKE